jgi:hypothetical protein
MMTLKHKTDTNWCLDEEIGEDGFRHIWPIEDRMLHILEGVNCLCSPRIDLEYNLVIHNRTE